MKVKRKVGMGHKRRRRTKTTKHKHTNSFRGGVLKETIAALRKTKNLTNLPDLIKIALNAAKTAVQRAGGKKKIQTPRVIPIPKHGGFLPFLIQLFASLSATGALAGGAAGMAKAVNDAKSAKRQLEEAQRHNQAMESIALGKTAGHGLYLKPYKTTGLGLYLKPYSSNKKN